MFSNRRVLSVCVLAAITGVLVTNSALAKKPPPPPPPSAPLGTIFFKAADDYYAVKGDSSDRQLVIPRPVALSYYASSYGEIRPSHLVYGTDARYDRWWLGVKAVDSVPEIFAFKRSPAGSILEVQLTGMGVAEQGPFFRGLGARWQLQWGPQDAFVSFKTVEYEVDDNGDPVMDSIVNHVVRLEVSGSDIELAAGLGLDLNVTPDSPAWSVAATIANGYEGNFESHDWSPSGTSIVYSGDDDTIEPETAMEIFVQDTLHPEIAPEKIWEGDELWAYLAWSPDASDALSTIAVTTYGSVYFVDSATYDTSTFLPIHLGNKNATVAYDHAVWSPLPSDLPMSPELLVMRSSKIYRGLQPVVTYSLLRVNRLDSESQIVVDTGLDDSIVKTPIAWVPDVPADQ